MPKYVHMCGSSYFFSCSFMVLELLCFGKQTKYVCFFFSDKKNHRESGLKEALFW